MENLSSDEFMLIIVFGWLLGTLYDIIVITINVIIERAWIVKDYEKIIAKNLCTYDTDDYKEKKLIANAKYNVEKINIKMQKRNKFFNKIFKRKSDK